LLCRLRERQANINQRAFFGAQLQKIGSVADLLIRALQFLFQ
jgi:hypothetical protein